MNRILSWAEKLVIIVLLTNFLQLLLPEGDLQKYVRVVMGFFIIIIFLSPLAELLSSDPSGLFKIFPPEEAGEGWGNIEKSGNQMEDSSQQLLREEYEKRAAEQIDRVLELEFPGYRREIRVVMNEEYSLKEVIVILSSRNSGVEEINIGEKEQKDEKNEREKQEMIRKVKERLGTLYQIPPGDIEVEFEEEED
ncbi:MAG: stage III sporulation protein AF [Halanaerobiaceae bacterium]